MACYVFVTSIIAYAMIARKGFVARSAIARSSHALSQCDLPMKCLSPHALHLISIPSRTTANKGRCHVGQVKYWLRSLNIFASHLPIGAIGRGMSPAPHGL